MSTRIGKALFIFVDGVLNHKSSLIFLELRLNGFVQAKWDIDLRSEQDDLKRMKARFLAIEGAMKALLTK